ncbi:MAG: hypothetical protein LUH40_06800 [Clostridiales bacterium]|nr:hypothetical protein [Clostridiales bacterium]
MSKHRKPPNKGRQPGKCPEPFNSLADIAGTIAMSAVAANAEAKHHYSEKGKINPYTATAVGMSAGLINNTKDIIRTGAVLGILGSFDDDDDESGNDLSSLIDTNDSLHSLNDDDDLEDDLDFGGLELENNFGGELSTSELTQSTPMSAPITLSFKTEAPDAVKRSDYPDERKYDAACRIYDLKHNNAFIFSGTSVEQEIDRCQFILNSDTIAAQYITANNDFQYAQAVKDNFSLPITVPDDFECLFLDLVEVDTALAVKVWSWCVLTFSPYTQYMRYKQAIFNDILGHSEKYPPKLLDLTIREMENNPDFLTGILEKNPQFPSAGRYIAYALQQNRTEIAVRMFRSAISHPNRKVYKLEQLINEIINDCKNWEELETMEAFKFHIFPIIKQIKDKRIRRLLPRFEDSMDSYIESVESNCKKYQYSRRFAWRKTCKDGSGYGLDPLNFQTEEEYNKALLKRKYKWRTRLSYKAEKYGLNVTDYETEEKFMSALKEAQKKAGIQWINGKEVDPLAETDTTVYTFCGVIFPNGSQIYHYRTDDESLTVGDMVVVPVGRNGKEEVAEIVTVEKHRRRTAPYPVDKAKFIKHRYEDNK